MTKTNNTKTQEATKQKPIKQFRIHGTAAAVWKREKDGEIFHTVSLDRTYRDKDGNWKRTSSFAREELEVVIRLATEAKAFLDTLENPQA